MAGPPPSAGWTIFTGGGCAGARFKSPEFARGSVRGEADRQKAWLTTKQDCWAAKRKKTLGPSTRGHDAEGVSPPSGLVLPPVVPHCPPRHAQAFAR